MGTCAPSEVWDASICQCATCSVGTCDPSEVWDASICACVTCPVETCDSSEKWDYDTCRCEDCNPPAGGCDPKVWVDSECECACEGDGTSCNSDQDWNENDCSCVCKDDETSCNSDQDWVEEDCKCENISPKIPEPEPIIGEYPPVGGDPVYLNNGESDFFARDLEVKGRSLDVIITRYFRSKSEYSSCFGYGWDMGYNLKVRRIHDDSSTIIFTIIFFDGKNGKKEYTLENDKYINQTDIGAYFEYDDVDETFTYIKEYGEKHIFDMNGNISEITDRNGNSITFEYDLAGLLPVYGPSDYFLDYDASDPSTGGPQGGYGVIAMMYKIKTITNDLGRQINFDYYGSGDSDGSEGLLKTITEVVDPTDSSKDRVWTYKYYSKNTLRKAISPETTVDGYAYPVRLTTTYTYDADNNLMKVYDPAGQNYLHSSYLNDGVSSQTYGTGDYGFTYFPESNMATVNNRKDVTKIIAYNDAGNVESTAIESNILRTDPGAPDYWTTSNEYTQLAADGVEGKIKERTFPKGNSVSYTYDESGNILTVNSNSDPDLVGYWRMNDSEFDMIVMDSSGNGNHGTAQQNTEDISTIGVIEGALTFNPTTDYINLGSPVALDNLPADDFTVSAWIYDESQTDQATIIGVLPGGGVGWILRKRGTGSARYVDFWAGHSTTAAHFITPEGSLTADTWHHIVAVWDGTAKTCMIYIDGFESSYITERAGVGSYSSDASYDKEIGRMALSGGAQFFEGIIDEVMIYNNALSAAEVESLYETFGEESGIKTTSYTYEPIYNLVKTITDPGANETVFTYDYENTKPLVINEFMAQNDTFNQDPAGDYDDWFELYNADTTDVVVGSMYLTDNLSVPTKWLIPAGTTIPAGGHLLIWADNEPAQPGLHANFTLEAGGEQIGLFDTDGVTLTDFIIFGQQTPDTSYGRYPDGTSGWQFFSSATPGAANNGTEVGNLVKITYPAVLTPSGMANPTVRFTYDSYGQVETITAPDGLVTKYEYYDAPGTIDHGRLQKVILDPGGSDITVQYEYDEFGNVKTVTNADGNTQLLYNSLGKLIELTAPVLSGETEGYKTKFSYTPNLKLEKIQAQLGATFDQATCQTTDFTYNILDKLTTVTDSLNNLTTYGYDNNDNLDSIEDAEQHWTTYDYDERDLPWKVTDELGNETKNTYDLNGNISKIEDAEGNITEYSYDGFDRLSSIEYPDDSTEEFGYDAAGNMTSYKTRAGENITYTYNALNLLESKTIPGAAPRTITYLYDIAGRLYEVDDNGSVTEYYYDTLGRISSIRDPQTRDVGYDHDNMHRRNELTYPDSSFITYDYDEMGRLTDIIDDDGTTVLAHYDYDELSRRTLLTYNNGTSVSYDYEDEAPVSDDDLGNRLEQIDNNINGTYITFDYTYDDVGNRLSEIADGTPHDYVYDFVYQLTDVDTGATTYSYDSVGNRLTMDDGTSKAYSSNNLNQYTTNGDGTYSYNSNGCLTGDGSYAYAYDSENHLVSIASLAVYEYDYLGRRTAKTTGGVTTEYVYDGDQVIAEYDDSVTQGTFVLVRKFIYGPGIDEPIIMIVKGTPDQYYYYHFDGLGSVVALSNNSGNIVEAYSYDVFGEPTVRTGAGTDTQWFTSDDQIANPTVSAIGNPYMFTGRRFDSESGLYYYRARMYHPELGRFMQPDPIGYYDGMNMYAYVGNNPINRLDPLGLLAIIIDLGGGLGHKLGVAGEGELVYILGRGWYIFTAGGGGMFTPKSAEGHLYCGLAFGVQSPEDYRRWFFTLSGNSAPFGWWPGIGGGGFTNFDGVWGFKLGPVYGTPGGSFTGEFYKQRTGDPNYDYMNPFLNDPTDIPRPKSSCEPEPKPK